MDQISSFYDVLGEFSAEFILRPFDYLYESEIQAELYGRLRKKIDTRIQYKTSDDFRKKFVDVESIPTTPVRLEYPSGHRFDVALLDETSMSNEEWIWSQDVKLAAEIKLAAGPFNCKVTREKMVDGFRKDIEKLHKHYHDESSPKITRVGVAVLFMQDELLDWRTLVGKEMVEGIKRAADGIVGVVVVASSKTAGGVYSVAE